MQSICRMVCSTRSIRVNFNRSAEEETRDRPAVRRRFGFTSFLFVSFYLFIYLSSQGLPAGRVGLCVACGSQLTAALNWSIRFLAQLESNMVYSLFLSSEETYIHQPIRSTLLNIVSAFVEKLSLSLSLYTASYRISFYNSVNGTYYFKVGENLVV